MKKALIVLRGSMREVDRENLLTLGYNVTWVEDIESIRQLDSTSLRDTFAAAAVSGNIKGGGVEFIAKEAYALADAMIAERAKTQ